MILSIVLVVILLAVGSYLVYKKWKLELTDQVFWMPFIAIVIATCNMIQSTIKYSEITKIEKLNKELAMKTSDLVAIMSSYTGWGGQAIPIKEERLNFYKTILEKTSDLIKSSGGRPEDFKSLKELRGVIKTFKPQEELITRPSSLELQSLGEN